MPFVKYFKILFLFVYMFSQSALALIVEKKCGKYIFQVEVLHEKEIDERQYVLYYINGRIRSVFYRVEPGIALEAACIQNSKQQYLMLFQEFCGGNDCPEDIYGVFDPSANKILINPSDWPQGNTKEVERLIGYPPPFYSDENEVFFCCTN